MRLKEIHEIQDEQRTINQCIKNAQEQHAMISARLQGLHCPTEPGCYVAKEASEDGPQVIVVRFDGVEECSVVGDDAMAAGYFTQKGVYYLDFGPKVPDEVAPALAQALAWLQEKPEGDDQ